MLPARMTDAEIDAHNARVFERQSYARGIHLLILYSLAAGALLYRCIGI